MRPQSLSKASEGGRGGGYVTKLTVHIKISAQACLENSPYVSDKRVFVLTLGGSPVQAVRLEINSKATSHKAHPSSNLHY